MKIVRVKSTGNEYAMPVNKYSELPVMRIVDGFPSNTLFRYNELKNMIECGRAEIVGNASINIKLDYKKEC